MTNDKFLTPLEASELFDYDCRTGIITWKFRENGPKEWNTRYVGKVAGTLKKGYVQISLRLNNKPKFYSGQRLGWVLHYGVWPIGEVDHINHKTDDNRIVNLRDSSHSQNGCNKNELRGQIPFKGVYFMKAKGRFAAQIKVNKKHKWLGLFDDAVSAARAYDKAACDLHGSFAMTNTRLGLL